MCKMRDITRTVYRILHIRCRTPAFHRRLATGNVQCVCSASYQIFFNIFQVIDPEPEPRTLALNPNRNPITDPNPNPKPKNKRKWQIGDLPVRTGFIARDRSARSTYSLAKLLQIDRQSTCKSINNYQRQIGLINLFIALLFILQDLSFPYINQAMSTRQEPDRLNISQTFPVGKPVTVPSVEYVLRYRFRNKVKP